MLAATWSWISSVPARRTFTPSRKTGAGADGGRKPACRPDCRRRQSPTLAVSRDRYDLESQRQSSRMVSRRPGARTAESASPGRMKKRADSAVRAPMAAFFHHGRTE